MRYFILLSVLFVTACASHYKAPTRQLDRMYVDCANKQQQERYLEGLMTKKYGPEINGWNEWLVGMNPDNAIDEIEYRKRVRSLLWEVRSTCG
jgi:hypothetical protein